MRETCIIHHATLLIAVAGWDIREFQQQQGSWNIKTPIKLLHCFFFYISSTKFSVALIRLSGHQVSIGLSTIHSCSEKVLALKCGIKEVFSLLPYSRETDL